MPFIQFCSELAAQKYYEAEESGNEADFLAVMEFEEQMYLNLLFEHYDACVLFFCKSYGSSAEEFLNAMISHDHGGPSGKNSSASGKLAFSKDQIHENVWKKSGDGGAAVMSVVSQIRRKIGDGYIETVVGSGYRFVG